jgi:hypothetical protein
MSSLGHQGSSLKREAEAARGVDGDVRAARGVGGGAGATRVARRQAPKYLQ